MAKDPYSPPLGPDNTGRTDISVVIPAYRSGRVLPELYRRLRSVLGTCGATWEIVVVDDGSGDDTYDAMRRLRKGDPRVRIMRLTKNCGQHMATLCGLRNAKGDWVVTMDDDLQHPPEEIVKIIRPLKHGRHVVIGRYAEKRHGLLRNAASWIAEQASGALLSKPRDISWSSFKGFSRYAVESITRHQGKGRYLASLILASVPHDSIVNVDVAHHDRWYGTSGYSWRKLASLFLDLTTFQTAVSRRNMNLCGTALIILSCVGNLSLSLLPHGGTASACSAVFWVSFLFGMGLLALGISGWLRSRVVGKCCDDDAVMIAEREG